MAADPSVSTAEEEAHAKAAAAAPASAITDADEPNEGDAVPMYVDPLQRKFSTSLDKPELLLNANIFITTTPHTNQNERATSLVVSMNPFLRMAHFKEPSLNTIAEAIIMRLPMAMMTMRLSPTILYLHKLHSQSYFHTRLIRGITAMKSRARIQRSSEGYGTASF